MKNIKNTLYIVSILLSIIFCECYSSKANAQVSEESSIIDNFKNEQRELLVGVRQDSYPIAYYEDGEWRGFCIDLSDKLSEYIQDKLNISYKIKPEYTATNDGDFRFQFVKEEKVHLECGPNTIFDPQNLLFSDEIKQRYEGVDFSNPFFETGARLIIKRKNYNKFKENLSLDPKYFDDHYISSITTIENTTTELLIKSIYQSYDETYRETDNRNTGFRAVTQDEALAFALDSVILEASLERGRLAEETIDRNEYILFPENSFLSYEFYGLVVNQNEQEWKKFLNKFLGTREIKALIKTKLTEKYDTPQKLSVTQQNNVQDSIWSLINRISPILLMPLLIFTLIIIVRLIYLNLKILKLEFGGEEEFDWNVFFETLNELQESHPDLKLHNIKLRGNNINTILVDIKVPKNKNKSTFTHKFISLYKEKISIKNKGAVGSIKISTRLIWESLVRANVGEVVRRIWF